jgi:hypothetical protein
VLFDAAEERVLIDTDADRIAWERPVEVKEHGRVSFDVPHETFEPTPPPALTRKPLRARHALIALVVTIAITGTALLIGGGNG